MAQRSRSSRGRQIVEFLASIYPESATMKEISSKIGPCCGRTVNEWIRTLVSRDRVELCGKRGSANIYRLKK